jgi:hypothetical protein
MVDPEKKQVVVLRLRAKSYRVHGEFGSGDVATSALLAGFQIDVKPLFVAAKPHSR